MYVNTHTINLIYQQRKHREPESIHNISAQLFGKKVLADDDPGALHGNSGARLMPIDIVVLIDLKTIALRAQPARWNQFPLAAICLSTDLQRQASSVDQYLCAESLGTWEIEILGSRT